MRSSDRARRFSAIGTPDLTEARWCIGLFIAIALPVYVAMAFLLGPFQGADETPHFLRAVQISEGRMIPEVQSGHAGATLDSGVARIGGYYQYLMYGTHGRYGEAANDRRAIWRQKLTGISTFAAFSNTVIYFPLAHALPAASIALARSIGLNPMAWLYVGRITGVLAAIGIYVVAIMIFPQGRALIFVIALLPRTIFSTAAMSADTLIIPLSAVFAALAFELWRNGKLSAVRSALLSFSAFYVCVSKLAYVPLLAAPPLLALASKRRDWKAVWLLSLMGTISVVVWVVWMKTISHDVFSIRPGYKPNIYAQLKLTLLSPTHDAHVAIQTLKMQGTKYINSMVGGAFGMSKVTIPRKQDALLYVVLLIAGVIGSERQRLVPIPFATTITLVSSCVASVFLLIYMQYNNPGADFVDGVQGRYFLPLLPLGFAFTPKFPLAPEAKTIVTAVCAATLALVAWELVTQEYSYYEVFKPVEGVRYGQPDLTWLE